MARKKRVDLTNVNNGLTCYDQVAEPLSAETLTLILETLKRIEARLVSVSSPVIQHPCLQMRRLPPTEWKRQ